MSAHVYTPNEIDRLKREAKALRKAEGIPHHEALNRIAVREGYPDWWHLQHLASDAPDTREPIVRVAMDSKDLYNFDDDGLRELGFVRDTEFAGWVAELRSPDKPWDEFVEVVRFLKSPGSLRNVLTLVRKAFFFPPEEIYYDDKLIPESAWTGKQSAWVIMGGDDAPTDPAARIAYGLLRPISDGVTTDAAVRTAFASAKSAERFVFDWYVRGQVVEASFAEKTRIPFKTVVRFIDSDFIDDPDDDGEKVDVTVAGVAVRDDKSRSWSLASVSVVATKLIA